MSKVHYSPRTPLYLFGTGTVPVQQRPGEKTAYLFFKEKQSGLPEDCQWLLSPDGDPAEAAWNLYDSLYKLDQAGFGSIMAELLPETGAGLAVNDRLRKAAQPYSGK
jgi:L-threonylcarbamoyladenylate synthase